MKKSSIPVALLLLIACHATQSFAQYPQWGDLKPGPHAIGFSVINRFDYGRFMEPKLDYEGKQSESNKAYPIQISVWYPAVETKNKRMLYEEYLYIENKSTLKPLTEDEKKQAAEGFRTTVRFGAPEVVLTDEQISKIFKTPAAATRNAKNLAGPFPVIICIGNPKANILYEYLASLGYVVVCSSSTNRAATQQASKPQLAIDESIRTFEYLMDYAHSLSYTDCTKAGVLGVNFEGMRAILFQMKHMQADAVVSIDGWEGAEGSKQIVMQSPFFDVNKLRVPYFLVKQHEKEASAQLNLSPTVFDTLRYAERWYYVLKDMNHSYLISNISILPDLSPEKRSAYQFLYTSVGNFFNAYIKKSPEGISFLQRSAASNGYPAEIILNESKKPALPAVPTPEEFEKLMMSEQFDKAMQIVREAKKNNPHVRLMDRSTYNLFSFRFSRQNKNESVLAIRQICTEAFPNSMKAMEYLGDAYSTLNNVTEARQCYEKAIGLFDRDTEFDVDTKTQVRDDIREKIKKLESK